jgi:hypothetical protein
MVKAFTTGGTPAKEIVKWKPTNLRMTRRPKMKCEDDVKYDSKVMKSTNGICKLKVGMNGGGRGGAEEEKQQEEEEEEEEDREEEEG